MASNINILLGCLVVNHTEGPKQPFFIEVSSTNVVGHLKLEIHRRARGEGLFNLEGIHFNLWKLKSPLIFGAGTDELHQHLAHFTFDADDSALTLLDNPMAPVAHCFPNRPLGCIHLVVQVTPEDNILSSSNRHEALSAIRPAKRQRRSPSHENLGDNLILNCLAVSHTGVPLSNGLGSFGVEVSSANPIGMLEVAIRKRGKELGFFNADGFKLTLWALKPPLRTSTTQELLVDLATVKLDSTSPSNTNVSLAGLQHTLINKHFKNPPPPECIHVLVQFPQKYAHTPSSSAYAALGEETYSNPGDRLYRIATILHKELWGKGHMWSKITYTSDPSDRVPSLIDDEDESENVVLDAGTSSGTPKIVEYVDIRKLLSWTEQDDEDRWIQPEFLVRGEYTAAESHINRVIGSGKRRILILGQPGIGKTVFLTYYLLKSLIKGQTTIIAYAPDCRFLFCPEGVVSIPANEAGYSTQAEIGQAPKGGVVLYDINGGQPVPVSFRGWTVVAASSPNPRHYKDWNKNGGVSVWAMKTWSWPEIYFARNIVPKHIKVEDLRTRFIKYGGSARFLLRFSDAEIEERIKTAIANRNPNDLLLGVTQGFKNDASHAVIQLNPLDPDTEFGRGLLCSQIATHHLRELLQIYQAGGTGPYTKNII